MEHFYQAHKSRDMDHQVHVRFVASPKEVKRIGRACKNLRPDWSDWRMEVMLTALVVKFAQNPALQDRLLATGDHILVETSPQDAFWGHGPDGLGENRLGYLLTSLRDVLSGVRNEGQAVNEHGLFMAVLNMHSSWWEAGNAARDQAQRQALDQGPDCGLGIMVRDTTLSTEQFNRYQPGAVLLEPGFLTGSGDISAGLAAPVRFVLFSLELRNVALLSLHAQVQPCMAPAGLYWKVMGRFVVEDIDGGPGQIVLLQVPPDAAHLFDSLIFTELEASIYQTMKQRFMEALATPPNPACQQADWLEQVSDPVGFTASGDHAKCWINGMAQHNRSA